MARRRHHHWQRRNNFHGRGRRRRGGRLRSEHLSLAPSRSSIMMEVRSFIEMIDAKSPPKVAEAAATTTMAAALASASIVNDYPGRAIQGHSLSRGRGRALRRCDIPSLFMRKFVGVFPARGIFLNQSRIPLPPSPRLFFLGRGAHGASIGYAHRNKVDREGG